LTQLLSYQVAKLLRRNPIGEAKQPKNQNSFIGAKQPELIWVLGPWDLQVKLDLSWIF